MTILVNYFSIAILLITFMKPLIIFDFREESHLVNWRIVDDVVMGGRSSGTLSISEEGYGIYEGYVSLENNGGFSSLRYRMKKKGVADYTHCVIRLKGDGKKYQFRLKSDISNYYSYIAFFETTGAWQEIEIPLEEMYPAFRGRKLYQPNFSRDSIEEIAFLIGNKKEENFKLTIDRIMLR